MTLSIIIVGRDTRDYLRECLASLYRHPPPVPFEVFVVDNASSDGSGEMTRRLFPEVILIENATNMGFAAANNAALRIARGTFVLLLNPDTLVLDGTFRHILDAMDECPAAGVVGGRLLNADGSVQKSYGTFPTLPVMLGWFLANRRRQRPERLAMTLARSHSDVKEVAAPIGAFFLVRKEAIGDVGLLDERFFVYGEEVDWCLRMKERGWKILFTPKAEIIHFGGGCSRQVPVEAFVYWIHSHRRLHRKHYGRLSAAACDGIILADIAVRIAGSGIHYLLTRREESRSRLRDAWSVFRGAFPVKGFRGSRREAPARL